MWKKVVKEVSQKTEMGLYFILSPFARRSPNIRVYKYVAYGVCGM